MAVSASLGELKGELQGELQDYPGNPPGYTHVAVLNEYILN